MHVCIVCIKSIIILYIIILVYRTQLMCMVVASQVLTTQPCVIVRASSGKVKDVFLVFEKKIISDFYLLLECLTFNR